MKTKYTYNPDVKEIYICIKGNYKGQVGLADFNYGHTFFWCFKDNGVYITDWNEGYWADKYIRRVGRVFRPKWDEYEERWVKVREKVNRND